MSGQTELWRCILGFMLFLLPGRKIFSMEQSFELYLHDLHDLPLLAPDDEQQLVARLQAGRQAAQRLEPCLASSERAVLTRVVADGEQARDQLVAAHLRLVVRIARQYTSRGVSLLDLIQEGNVALLQAAEHFDPAYEVRFATYATWWIRHAIAAAVSETGYPIRLPQNARRNVYRLYRARNDLLQRLEREPNEAELAEVTGLPVADVLLLSQYLQPVLSLNTPLGDEDTADLIDIVPDPVAELQLSAALQGAVAEELAHLLQSLTPDEKEVLAHRFGLYGQPLRSRQDVGKILGLSTDHVQHLEARALRKLRDPELVRQLEQAMDQ